MINGNQSNSDFKHHIIYESMLEFYGILCGSEETHTD